MPAIKKYVFVKFSVQFFLNCRMIGARALVKALPPARLGIQSRQVVSGPPNVRISVAEKAAFGIFMTVAFCTVPTWVLVHLREYRGLK